MNFLIPFFILLILVILINQRNEREAKKIGLSEKQNSQLSLEEEIRKAKGSIIELKEDGKSNNGEIEQIEKEDDTFFLDNETDEEL